MYVVLCGIVKFKVYDGYFCVMFSRLYSYGEYKAEDQEQMLAQLDKKVAEVYTKTIGPNEANIP